MNNSILIIHNSAFINLYFQCLPIRGSLQIVTKVITYYDRAVLIFYILVIMQVLDVVTPLIFNRHTYLIFRGGLEDYHNNKAV
jgi:hypothetical protein